MLRLPTDTQNTLANQFSLLIDEGGGGTIRIYDGVQPDSPNDRVGGQTLLVELPFSRQSFKDASFGTIIANKIPTQKAVATGDATWARILNGLGGTVFDCDVAESGAVINLNRIDIAEGGPVSIESFTITQPG